LKTYFTFDGIKVPVRIKKDWRSSVRFSITKTSINIIVPKHYVGALLTNEIEKLQAWSANEFKKNPELFSRFRAIVYEDGEFIKIYDSLFQLNIIKESRKTASAKISRDQKVIIHIPSGLDQQHANTLIGKVLSRVFGNYFTPQILDRVRYYNDLHFHEHIENVRLKNNASNWGSCSSDKNINLSSRLLFAPQEVIDYVIVHELSHLKEMNHSPAFWNIVRNIMPDYKEKEKWLDTHGESLRF